MKSDQFDDIWDEHQWESHLNQIEQKSEQFRHFLDAAVGEEIPRWYRLLKDSPTEQDALDAFIEQELLFDESYFPDDDDDWDGDDEFDDEDLPFGYLDEDDDEEFDGAAYLESFDDFEDPEDDDLEDGEEWKLLSEDFAMTDYGSIETLKVYNDAHSLAVEVLRMSEELGSLEKDQIFSHFVSEVIQIPAKITAGYALGFEMDVLGGNIVYNRKALSHANSALAALQSMRNKHVFRNREIYFNMHNALFEIRNDLGVYIQELREEFNRQL